MSENHHYLHEFLQHDPVLQAFVNRAFQDGIKKGRAEGAEQTHKEATAAYSLGRADGLRTASCQPGPYSWEMKLTLEERVANLETVVHEFVQKG